MNDSVGTTALVPISSNIVNEEMSDTAGKWSKIRLLYLNPNILTFLTRKVVGVEKRRYFNMWYDKDDVGYDLCVSIAKRADRPKFYTIHSPPPHQTPTWW